MASDLKTLLSPQNLLGLITTIKGGVPDYLPPGLFSNDRPCLGNRGTYRRIKNSRQLAPIVQYGAAPVAVDKQDVVEIPQTLLSSKIATPYDANFYSNLQALGGYGVPATQKYAEDLVAYETAELKRRVSNTMTASKYSILTLGNIYVDSSKNLTLTSGSAQQTFPAGIPTANIDTIATLSGVAGVWSDASSDIPSQLRAMKRKSVQETGFESMMVLYGINIPLYIRANTASQAMVSGNYVLASEQYQSTEIPARFANYSWFPQYGANYETSPGTRIQLWPDNLALFIPMPDPGWQEMLRGTTRIPTGFGVGGDPMATMMANTSDVSGMFSYATIDRHGQIEQVAGDCWFPVLTNPNVVYLATVA